MTAGAVRGLRLLWLAGALAGGASGALAGCAWLPWSGDEEEPAAAEEKAEAGKTPGAATSQGPCTRKGRQWAEGSRVCEDHAVSRCYSDGVWRVIGSC
jgi:hypothetical protein